MKRYLLGILLFIACSCGDKKNQTPTVSNIIDLTIALHNPREILLSELVDSISFVPFETTPQSNLSDAALTTYSNDYIFYHNMFFDWSGRFLGTIGTTGRGRLETLWPISRPVQVDDYFYGWGEKLIEFDLKGKATGKVRVLNSPIDRTGVLPDIEAFEWAGENFIAYNYPDSVYFINRDFQIIGSRQVEDVDTEKYFDPHKFAETFATLYDDKIVFYNFVNDTIFHAYGTHLEPKWIISLSEELRPDDDFVYDHIMLMTDALWGGNFHDSEFIRRSQGKHVVTAAYETDDYLFMPMKELVFLNLMSATEEPVYDEYLTYFVKSTGETIRVAGDGFVDDILGLDDYFYPKWGIYEEAMFSSIWPYQLHDLIAERRRSGTAIDPRLEALAANTKVDDNPILIMAHLKQKQ